MASEKKAIALLSMYGEEEEEADEMEESQQPSLFSPQQQQQQLQQAVVSDLDSVQIRKNSLTIVDYGHDEVAMSPEAEEDEIMETGKVKYGEELQMANGDEFREITSPGIVRLPTPSSLATLEDTVMTSVEEPKEIDPLDKFLPPPPPKDKCSEELQKKIIRFLSLKETIGRSFNSEVRNRKEYRNPGFLLHAVTYQDIDQIGSCFSKDVFDPHGYDESDFYDVIEDDMRREMERKEQEKKKNQKVDFILGGVQPGVVVPTPKVNMPIVPIGMLNTVQVAVGVVPRHGRQNKKSKWDEKKKKNQKVDFILGGVQPVVVVPTPKVNMPFRGLANVPSGMLKTVQVAVGVVPRHGRQNKKSKWDSVDTDQRNTRRRKAIQ